MLLSSSSVVVVVSFSRIFKLSFCLSATSSSDSLFLSAIGALLLFFCIFTSTIYYFCMHWTCEHFRWNDNGSIVISTIRNETVNETEQQRAPLTNNNSNKWFRLSFDSHLNDIVHDNAFKSGCPLKLVETRSTRSSSNINDTTQLM